MHKILKINNLKGTGKFQSSFLYVYTTKKTIYFMDLFNKKKLAALKADNQLLTAKLEATEAELSDLKKIVTNSYDDLTDYFNPKYAKKYFSCTVGGAEICFRCESAIYNAGLIEMDIVIAGESEPSVFSVTIPQLKQLKIITKMEYNMKGENK